MDAAERKRIVAAGGVLLNGRVDGQLEVSRAFGDARFKHHGVTAKPDILRATLVPEQDVFLLLACDGLWKVFSPDEAVTFVDALLQPPIPTAALASTTSQAAVNALVNEAIHKGSTDNVTAVLVRLHWPGLETTSPAF
jgi:integrin-linked kinase-associated serine/threonine phosphatase 2C